MNTADVLTGAGLGAAIAFMLDPTAGTRRRALMRDQLVRAGRKTRDGLDATARDVANRTRGVAAATRGRFKDDRVDDARLVERVRSRLGRVCSHPRAIDVDVEDGRVRLRGPILSSEVMRVLGSVSSVRGVRSVANELVTHESSEGVPSLQGGSRTVRRRLLQRRWSPATRGLVAMAGIAATGMWLAARR